MYPWALLYILLLFHVHPSGTQSIPSWKVSFSLSMLQCGRGKTGHRIYGYVQMTVHYVTSHLTERVESLCERWAVQQNSIYKCWCIWLCLDGLNFKLYVRKNCLKQEVCMPTLACVCVCDCDSFHMLSCVICPPHNNYHLCQINQRGLSRFLFSSSDLSYSFFSNIKCFLNFPLKESFTHLMYYEFIWAIVEASTTLRTPQIIRLVP